MTYISGITYFKCAKCKTVFHLFKNIVFHMKGRIKCPECGSVQILILGDKK